MKAYDPLKPPDPQEWLALDEYERMQLVERYHRRARIRMPNQRVHAAMHAAVENQIAMGDELPVKRKLEQLMNEGLDRHQAVHAIASLVARQIYRALKLKKPASSQEYYADLENLTAESWLRSGEDEEIDK